MNDQRIHALPLHLANQIAAGEVVERPASVLKELIENSIDAGATQIDINIEGAGSKLVKITDNGHGIHPDDLQLALSRHATSKLHSSDQLSQIDSLGFRGEALPSIASVSQLTLISRQPNTDCAWQITIDNPKAIPAAHPVGTSVEVADLFFNLPARRRFLRSDKTELHHLNTTFQRLALSRFDIGFSYSIDKQMLYKLPAILSVEDHAARISKVCGKHFIQNSLFLHQNFNDITLEGWIGNTDAHRPHTDVQYFFINGRVIRDRVITHAIRQAYADSLPIGRHAAFVLYLTLPLDRVDVNVHPTKHEVRFRDARLVHGLINKAIEEALQQPAPEGQVELPLTDARSEQIHETPAAYARQPLSSPITTSKAKENVSTHSPADGSLVVLQKRYALLQQPEPALIDLQQAAHELKQQQLREAIRQDQLTSRPILVPLQFHYPQEQFKVLAQHQTLLSRYALELSFNNDSVTVKRIPYLLSQVDIQQLLSSLIKSLQSDSDAEVAIKHVYADVLPKTSIENTQQANSVLQQLIGSDLHDKPWYRELDQQTLTGLFSTNN